MTDASTPSPAPATPGSLRAWRERWRLVHERELLEDRLQTPTEKFHQFYSLVLLARHLGWEESEDDRRNLEAVRARWRKARERLRE